MAGIRKHTTVRITDPAWTLRGTRWLITGKQRSQKGIKQMELSSLETENRTTWATIEQVTPEYQLTVTDLQALDAHVITVKAQQEANARDFEARMQEEARVKLQMQQADDAAWNHSVPELKRAWSSFAGDNDVSFEVKVTGPERTARDGTTKYREEDEVTVYLRRGRYGLPKDYVERQINWCSMGSVSVARARSYARAILAAADFAEAEELALQINDTVVHPNQVEAK
jgi:hypothetical protein